MNLLNESLDYLEWSEPADALDAMRRIKARPGENDGSRRLFAVASRGIEYGLSETENLAAIRQYELDEPFPRDYTDAEITKRIRDAKPNTVRTKANKQFTIEDAEARYAGHTMQGCLDADFNEEYIVEDVVIRGMPGIWGGASKTVKTGQMLDLGYNISTGGKFLGKFQCKKCKVLILTGESGGAAIKRRLQTFVAKYGKVAEPEYFFISEALPKFKSEDDLQLLKVLIEARGYEVVVVDPLYVCMGGSKAGDIQSQGELLYPIGNMCSKLKVTLLCAHHVTKSAARETNKLLSLEDLTQAGFAEWARQWFLINRREKYKVGSGIHKFSVSLGNSSNHSAEWAIDLDEGTKDSPKWEVKVYDPAELRVESKAEHDEVEYQCCLPLVLEALKGGPLKTRDLKAVTRLSGHKWNRLRDRLLSEGVVSKTTKGKAEMYSLEAVAA